jgi:hypothetical protein
MYLEGNNNKDKDTAQEIGERVNKNKYVYKEYQKHF